MSAHVRPGAPASVGLGDRVYPFREDSALLLPFARVRPGSSFLEVGCGGGWAVLAAARAGARAVATDRNPHALRWVRDRAHAEGLVVGLVRTDLASGLGRFERVVANPPYLPLPPAARDPDPWHHLAVDGGLDGCRTSAPLIESLPAHLVRGGSAFLVVSSLQSPPRMARLRAGWMRTHGAVREVAAQALGEERLFVWEFQLSADPAQRPR